MTDKEYTLLKATSDQDEVRVEDLIEKVIGEDAKSTAKFLCTMVFVVGLLLITLCFMSVMPLYTGSILYTEWTCVSERCHGIIDHPNTTYNRDAMCDNDLKAGVDFNWTSKRRTYTMDWDIYCGDESKVSIVNSSFYIGAIIGLLTATTLFDTLGRKRTTIVSALVGFASTLGTAFVQNTTGLTVFRVIQGCGGNVMYTGLYVWMMEFTPRRLRNPLNLCIGLYWAIGGLILNLIGYLTMEWQFIPIQVAIFILILTIPLIFVPESPRFNLIMGNEAEAKKTLEKLAKIFGTSLSFDNIKLVYEDHQQNHLKQLKDFWKYKEMLKETLTLVVSWTVLATLSYGLLFSWGKLGGSIYLTMLISWSFGIIGNGINFLAIQFLGRKRSAIFVFGSAGLSFLLGMVDVNFSDRWNMSLIACLIGNLFLNAAWDGIYLITGELAPTSHRGMIMGTCSVGARVGSFVGPFISLLYNVLDQKIVLAIFGAMAFTAASMFLLLPDTTGKAIPDTPADLKRSRDKPS